MGSLLSGSKRPSSPARAQALLARANPLVWLAIAAATAVDALTFCFIPLAGVAAKERNPLARDLTAEFHSGLPGVLVLKLLGGAVFLAGIYLLRRGGLPRWAESLFLGGFVLFFAYGAFCNVAYGWA